MEIAQQTSSAPAITSISQAMDCDIGVGSGRKLEQMRVVAHEEGAQQLRIVRAHRSTDARTLRQFGAPCADLRHIAENAVVGQLVEQIEVAEDGGEYGVDETERFASKIRTGTERRFDPGELHHQRLALALERRRIGR